VDAPGRGAEERTRTPSMLGRETESVDMMERLGGSVLVFTRKRMQSLGCDCCCCYLELLA
jgi:hypothetical protein